MISIVPAPAAQPNPSSKPSFPCPAVKVSLPNLVPPEVCRRFLVETYTNHREYIEPLVLIMLGGMERDDAFIANWADLNGSVLCINEVGHSIHLHRNAGKWLEYCRQPGSTGPICRVRKKQWNTYKKRLLDGNYDSTALGNCCPHYERVFRKGSEFWSTLDAINDVNSAILFDFLFPEAVLSALFDERVVEIRRPRPTPLENKPSPPPMNIDGLDLV
jgi:hypothetical protein